MKTIGLLCLSLVLTTGLFAQNRSGFINAGPPTVRTFPSAVFPGGTSALPGVQRTTGSVVYPGGGTAQIGVPGIRLYNPAINGRGGNFNGPRRNGGGVVTTYGYPVAVPVPVYVGGGDPGAYGAYYDQPAPVAQAPQQPNIIVIYPPAPAAPAQPAMMVAPQPVPEASAPAPASGNDVATHYLIAFKDHSIYSAVAYWVDGDTLHYFTTGNTHNQVSLSLVDRDLTKRLNEESGLQVNLPAAR